MPIYEFQCKKCQHVFEVFTGVYSKKRHMCPECKSSALRRLISRVQTRFDKDFYEEQYKAGAFD